jgi:hypothetical protein
MKNKTLTRYGAAAAIALALVAVAPMSANAAAPTATDPYSEARSFLATHGVDAAVQDRLISEYDAGGKWDSFSSESVAVSTTETLENGYKQTVSHYADGSVSVSRMEQPRMLPKGSVGTQSSPNGCTVSGNMRNNCNVDTWVGVIQMSFKASYNVSTNRVTNVYGGGWQIGGACSVTQTYLGIPASNIGRMDLSAQMCVVGYSSAFFLQVTLKNGVATESWNG